MITRDDGFSWVPPRISEERFVSELENAGSPLARLAPMAYEDAVNVAHVDPAFMLAIYKHESGYGTNPQSVNVRYGNNNPGNLRNPPPYGYPTVQTDRGPFLSFPSVLTGWSAMADHLDSSLYHGLTIGAAIEKWAPPQDNNNTEAYIAAVLDSMNSWRDTTSQGGNNMVRIVVSAGHENIGAITADKIGQQSADALRGGTGALGTESQYNAAVADELVRLLASAGVDAVRTDAIYHPDVYGVDADLVIVCHADGVSGTPGQWAGASVVHSGPSTVEADNRAQQYVDAWRVSYSNLFARLFGDNNGANANHLTDNPTVGMQQYYGGWYRTANTPMVLIEGGIWGDANGQRTDIPSPGIAALADAEAAAQVFNIGGITDGGTAGLGTAGTSGDSGNPQSHSGAESGSGSSGTVGQSGGTSGEQSGSEITLGNGTVTVTGYERSGDGRGFTVNYPGGNVNGYRVGHGFFDSYTNGGRGSISSGYERYGVPRSSEFAAILPGGTQSVTLQIFDRTIMVWDGDHVDTLPSGILAARYLHSTGIVLPSDMAW